MASLRTVAPRVGFRSDTRSGISWCHALSRDASKAVTDLGENIVPNADGDQKKRSSPQISGVFGRKLSNCFHIIKWCHLKVVTPGRAAPASDATDPVCVCLSINTKQSFKNILLDNVKLSNKNVIQGVHKVLIQFQIFFTKSILKIS